MTSKQGRLLVVDDDRMNRVLLAFGLREEGYQVDMAENGSQALEMLKSQEYDILLLDLLMPEMDGYTVLQTIKMDGSLKSLPVIVISAVGELESIVRCVEMGADDYLYKPFDRTLLRARVSASLEKKRLRDQEIIYRKQIEEYNLHLENRVQAQVRQITAAQLAINFALAKLAESRDLETGLHLERVQEYCRILLERLRGRNGYEFINNQYIYDVCTASSLHDIGKVGIPDAILLKPARLTEEEFVIMRTHTEIGAETLRRVNQRYPGNHFLQFGIEIAEGHHEWWDGSGYPRGVSHDAIPLSARVVALADVYDALISRRVYKESYSREKSRQIILDECDSHFDPLLVECFQIDEEAFNQVREKYSEDT